MIKVISFDLDETLADKNFDDVFWFKEIPKLYAEQNNISFKQAHDYITKQYDKTGPDELLWYNVDYWFKKYETICKTCGASSRKGSLKCWVCGRKLTQSTRRN